MNESAPNVMPQPVTAVAGRTPYHSDRDCDTCDLLLDSNEGPRPADELVNTLVYVDPTCIQRYPNTRELECDLAQHFRVTKQQVLVTNGGDDAIDRICRAFLDHSRELVQHVPTFEMIQRYAALVGATVRYTSWPGGCFPIDEMLSQVGTKTGVIAVVSPNNPTGAVVGMSDIRRLSMACPTAVVLLDLAYVEFADDDIMASALELPNVLVIRTFSKARGLAGQRVGFVVGPEQLIEPLRVVGGPYPVSGISVAVARQQLATGDAVMRTYVQQVRRERAELQSILEHCGASVQPSQGNFVFCRVGDAAIVRSKLVQRGVRIRAFINRPDVTNALRITCPGNAADFARLIQSLCELAKTNPEIFTFLSSEQVAI